MPSVRTPREIRNERSAPATTASTTSLTVPPKAFLTSLKSWSELADPDEAPVRADVDVQRRLRRRVQTGPDDLADALGRLARAGKRVIWVRERVERALREREPGPHGAAAGRRPGARRRRALSAAATRARSAAAAAGPARGRTAQSPGRSRRSRRSARGGSLRSARSGRPWSPSINHISHSGLERSSCWEKIQAVRPCSCSQPPGVGSAAWRMWYSRLKLGSSTHTGLPLSSAVWASLWR